MRGSRPSLDSYVYWFPLEALRWLDNGSIDEVELVYEEDGPAATAPEIWKEFRQWASQDWRENPRTYWSFGWDGAHYIEKWTDMKWRFKRLADRTLDRRGRFIRYWDYDEDSEETVEEKVEEKVVWSVKRDDRSYNRGISGRLGDLIMPSPTATIFHTLALD
ncbi:hypothetical protein TWF481_010996 [Arthrobotrys musiformis]|uniref:Uncharacterized protein n=1 Tax=Arthrobotrys musiformis TaxID=47236 RepID=A0AAV9VWZ6_9PEZI